MYDIKALKAAGYSPAKMRKLFEEAANSTKATKVTSLVNVHMERIETGIRHGLSRARIFRAIDEAYNLPLDSHTVTLVRGYINRHRGKSDAESIVAARELASELGLSRMLTPMKNARGQYINDKGKPVSNLADAAKSVDLPTFFEVAVPIAMTYTKVRQASLFQGINLFPFFNYEPNVNGSLDRALAKVMTRRVEQSVTATGIPAVTRQSILQMLKYGFCINFPISDWWKDTQIIDGKKVVQQEGIKMETPHPARTFYDQNYPLYTLNLETGCSYAGYWVMRRFQEMQRNKAFWNLDRLQVGTETWRTSADYNLYTKLYPCQIAFPDFTRTTGAGKNDREKNVFKYSHSKEDTGVDQVVMFDRIIPSEWGLYDYDYPVWHRFIYAGDRVNIHMQPWLYHPCCVDLYDHDGNADTPISLTLEAMPLQDHFGNLLTQQLLSVKKNLIRILGVNSDAVPKDFLDRMMNNSENAIRGIEVMEYSGAQLERQGLKFEQLFQAVNMPQANVVEQIGVLNSFVSFIERVLGFSPHELGVSASHQISAKEAVINTGASETRKSLTASHISDAQNCRKMMHYEALMAHGDDDFMVEVANLEDGQVELLKKAGLEVEKVDGRDGAAVVKGKKASFRFSSLFSTREDSVRTNDQQTAAAIFSFLDRAASNQALAEMLGPEKIAQIYNTAIQISGLPEELYLSPGKKTAPDLKAVGAVIQKLQEQMQQGLEAVSNQAAQAITPLAQKQQQTEQVIAEVAQAQQGVGQAVQELGAHAQQSDQAVAAISQQVGALSQKLSQLLAVIVGQQPDPMQG